MRSLELRVPPLVVVAAAAFLMWLPVRLFASLRLDFAGRMPATMAFASAGAAICILGIIEFRRARTTVDPTRPGAASTLVTRGIYRVSRNPMYLGFALILLGWCLHLASPLGVPALAAFVWYLDRFQIGPEERALAPMFGSAFEDYRRKVRRWI